MKVELINVTIRTELLDNALSHFSTVATHHDFDPKNTADIFLNHNPDIDEGEILFEFPVIWKDNIVVDGDKLTEKNEYIYSKLGMFIEELKDFATRQYVKKNKGFKKMDTPPKKAYEYVGHNKLDIKPSKISSALLYED